MAKEDQVAFLLEALRSQELSMEQEQLLTDLLLKAETDEALKESMQKAWDEFRPALHSNRVKWDKVFDRVLEKHPESTLLKPRFSWSKIAAAAILLLFVAFGSLYIIQRADRGNSSAELHTVREGSVTAPDKNKAALTLSDGSVILLENEDNGALAIQGNVTVEKTGDGEIVYKGSGAGMQMNTLTIPQGSKPLHLQLADGSKVWLNVGSTLTYPAAFTGTTRRVEISGEGYFEIARDASRPFIVEKGQTVINVLGTHFNVHAYDNEAKMRVTLLEGSVRIQKGNLSDLLRPGQQAVLQTKEGGRIQVVKAEVDKVMAWKNGLFNFEGIPFDEVMRQLERWYDIRVIYEKGIPDIEFVGKMSKNIPLDELLEILKKTKVNFRMINGRKLIVLNEPKSP